MKILHTADWHLGNVFHGHVRTDEHQHFLQWLLGVIEERKPDALLITGDVFDTANPSASAEELFYDFLLQATSALPGLQVVITAGNHDSAGRLEAPADLLKTHNVYVRGTIHYTAKGEPDFGYYLLPLASRQTGEAACVCMALPYLRSADAPAGLSPEESLRFFFRKIRQELKHTAFAGLPVIAAAHFYARGAEVCGEDHSERVVVGGQECVSTEVVGSGVSYTALGHIHKPQQAGAEAWYAGSALPMSFAEINYHHGAQWVELTPDGQANVSFIDYTPLRRLQTIPARGKAATAQQVLDEIASLPLASKQPDLRSWPYLEIHVEERQPEPSLMHDVMQALQDRAVYFCRMTRVRPIAAESAVNEANAQPATPDDLASTSPLDMARRYFLSRFGEEMPNTLVSRFNKAAEEAEH